MAGSRWKHGVRSCNAAKTAEKAIAADNLASVEA